MSGIRKVFLFAATFSFLWLALSAPCLGAQEGDLKTFDGLFGFAWIGADQQKELDMGAADFLVELRVKTEKVLRGNIGEIGLLAKKPLGNQPGYAVAMDGAQNLVICLNGVQMEKSGKPDQRIILGGYFKPGQWTHTAVLFEHSKKQVTVFTDGKPVKTFANISWDSLDNPADFTVGAGNFYQHVRFNGQIAFAGVWKFTQKAPANIQDTISKMAASEVRSDMVSAAGVRGSFWKLAKSDKGAEDAGNAGNFLFYMPENDKLRFEAMRKTYKAASPGTIYVDAMNPAATDTGEGTAERPFKTIQRGACFADAGDTVTVRKGVYREILQVSGGLPGAPIRFVAEKDVRILGTEPLRDWKKQGTEGVYALRGWKGTYMGPINEKAFDAQRTPSSIVFINGAPLEWVDYVEDLIPGSYTIWPREKNKPMDIHIFPLPGESPENSTIEIRAPASVVLTDFIEFEGFNVLHSGISLGGRGCVVKNNLLEWGGGIGVGGGDHKIIGNRVLWADITGLGGGGATGCLIEDNVISYANWRCYDPGWHGGGAKLIPSHIDNVVRKNIIEFSWGAGFWYDGNNAYNLIEYNIFRDNSGNGGIFDECGWANKFQYNVVYNTWCTRQNRGGGHGINIGESPEDYVYRNIVFNNERGDGLLIRSFANRQAYGSAEAVLTDAVKYPHHYVAYERQKKWLDDDLKYNKGQFIPQTDMKFFENISFNNHLSELYTARDYSLKNDPKASVYDFESDNNIFFNAADPKKIVGMADQSLPLEKWREISGKDKNSQLIDPFKDTDKLPQWARELFDFTKYKSRLAAEVVELNPDIRNCIGSMIFKSRIIRSTNYRKVKVLDPALRAFLIDCEGEKMLALWRTVGAGQARINTSASSLTFEDQWLKRKPIGVEDGKATVFVGRDPVYLIGVTDETAVDPTFKSKLYGVAKEAFIPSAPAKFKIDGNLSDWQALRARGPFAELSTERNVFSDSARKWEGPKDCSAKAYAAWDKDGLYFAFDVTDDSFVASGDVVDLFIDGRLEWKQFYIDYEGNCYHLRLEPSQNGVKISYPRKADGHSTPSAADVASACAVRPGGYTMEVFIPAKNFESQPLSKDTVIRTGMLLTDRDEGKQGDATMKWNAYRSSDSETTGWLPVDLK